MTPNDAITLHGMTVECIIGDEPWEREERQTIRCDVRLACDLRKAGASDELQDTINYVAVGAVLVAYIENSRFQMLEALAEGIARHTLQAFPIRAIDVTLTKQAHFPKTEAVSITIRRPV